MTRNCDKYLSRIVWYRRSELETMECVIFKSICLKYISKYFLFENKLNFCLNKEYCNAGNYENVNA